MSYAYVWDFILVILSQTFRFGFFSANPIIGIKKNLHIKTLSAY